MRNSIDNDLISGILKQYNRGFLTILEAQQLIMQELFNRRLSIDDVFEIRAFIGKL